MEWEGVPSPGYPGGSFEEEMMFRPQRIPVLPVFVGEEGAAVLKTGSYNCRHTYTSVVDPFLVPIAWWYSERICSMF